MPAEPADGEASDQELPMVFYVAATELLYTWGDAMARCKSGRDGTHRSSQAHSRGLAMAPHAQQLLRLVVVVKAHPM